MPKDGKEILVKTQDGGAIVGVKNVFLDSSQKDYSITGHTIGEFDDFQYSRFSKCENCEEEKDCKDCAEGSCWDHSFDSLINDPFDSDFCEHCEFEDLELSKMMLLARYNFKFEALYVLEKLFNAIQVGAKTFSFPKRLKKSNLVDMALSDGVKREEIKIPIVRAGKIATKECIKVTYAGLAEFEIFNHFFEVSPSKLPDSMFGEWELKFKNENPDLDFSIIL
jgi:hypothetical protein